MIPYLFQIAKEKQAEIRREASRMNRLSRISRKRKPNWIKRNIYIATAFTIGVILLLKFIG